MKEQDEHWGLRADHQCDTISPIQVNVCENGGLAEITDYTSCNGTSPSRAQVVSEAHVYVCVYVNAHA